MNRFAVGSGQTLFVQLVHNIVDDREGFFFVFDLCPKILKIGSNPLKSLPVFVEGVFRAGEIGRFRAIALWPGQQPVGGKTLINSSSSTRVTGLLRKEWAPRM